MKKILFVMAAFAVTSMMSCGNKTEASVANDTDTVVMDTVVDTLVVDTVVEG